MPPQAVRRRSGHRISLIFGASAPYVSYQHGNDYVHAQKWFNLAATQGHKKAAENRVFAAMLMTSAQIAEAQRLAREWLAKFDARKQK